MRFGELLAFFREEHGHGTFIAAYVFRKDRAQFSYDPGKPGGIHVFGSYSEGKGIKEAALRVIRECDVNRVPRDFDLGEGGDQFKKRAAKLVEPQERGRSQGGFFLKPKFEKGLISVLIESRFVLHNPRVFIREGSFHIKGRCGENCV